MRYNRKAMGMLNRDMLKRDLFFFLGFVVLLDIYMLVKYDGSEAMRTTRLLAIIFTVVVVAALVLFFVITRPRRIIPDALIDAAEEFEYIIPMDATKRMIADYAPGLQQGSVLYCCKGDEGFEKVCEALRGIQGARTKILPDYPRFNLNVHTAAGHETIGAFYENVTYGPSIYRVREDWLEKTLFNPEFTALFKEKTEG